MQIIRRDANARAGLIGNPSDGYHGKTLALIVPQFRARVTMYEWERVEILWSQNDRGQFDSVQELAEDVRQHGYYGGVRLVKATIKKFVDYCSRQAITLHDRNFSVRYETNIPRQVGLGGSSAIIVATLRCLMEFYGVDIPLTVQPSLALSVETDELAITAGLQDRVVQVYGQLVYMDFGHSAMHDEYGFECGTYEPLSLTEPLPLYLAYHQESSEPTEVFHNDLRGRYDRGENAVHEAMEQFAQLAVDARRAVIDGDQQRLGTLADANFDLRQSICQLPAWQVDMVRAARQAGASAKFAGSGGAIVGTCDLDRFEKLAKKMASLHCATIQLMGQSANGTA